MLSRFILFVVISFVVSGTVFSQTAEKTEQQTCCSHSEDSHLFMRELRSLNSGFPMQVPENLEQWQLRREKIKRQILISQGLWPMPEKTSANAVIQESVDCGEYKVFRVTLESYPGFYVTGNLYVPTGRTGPLPGVIYAHGHWPDARFYKQDDKQFQKDIESGAEKFDPSGRYPLQAACVGLARIGCVAFIYDMIGYSDSIQLPHLLGPREHMNTQARWGYYSPQAEMNLQNMMGLQTYDSLRVLDWFSSLPFVDSNRIGMTGASGGGTQTMILSAIDDRIAVSVPAVMVSTDMQGGCTCENAPYLRIGMGNIDIAAMFAPKPLAMTAADDWTKEMETKGFPELLRLFTMYGVPENTALFSYTQFPHNYNQVSREAMYSWMNKHLELGLNEPIVERPFTPLTIEQLTVWTKEHPKPNSVGEEFERNLLELQKIASDVQMQKFVPTDETSLSEFKSVVGGAYQTILNADNLDPAIDLTMIGPENNKKDQCVLWISEDADTLFIDVEGNRNPFIQTLIDKGITCATIHLPGINTTQTCMYTKDNGSDVHERYHYLYTFGYNDPLFVLRSREIVKAINKLSEEFETLSVVGLGSAGKWVALAVTQDHSPVDHVVIDTDGFRFMEKITSVQDPDFLPGAVKYFDLPGMIALVAPRAMLLFGESVRPELVSAAYRVSEAADAITLVSKRLTTSEKIQLVQIWLSHQ